MPPKRFDSTKKMWKDESICICLNNKMGKKGVYVYLWTKSCKMLSSENLIFKTVAFNFTKYSVSPNLLLNMPLRPPNTN